MSIDQRLAELGITLPAAAAPVAAYVPTVEVNGLLHVSGQISFAENGELITGRLGESLDLARGQAAARRCGIMLLAQLKSALGSLDRVERIVKLGVFVNSTSDFTDQPKVANGASELLVQVFGLSFGNSGMKIAASPDSTNNSKPARGLGDISGAARHPPAIPRR